MSISRASATALLTAVQRGLSPLELIYVPHERWPLPRSRNLAVERPLQISILDSSFNPPTLAHLALANAPRPPVGDDVGGDFDAKIYLLSVRNADKSLKSTDASYLQRLEMMLLLAQDSVADAGAHPVAIGIIDEPTFVGKASKLLAFIEERLSGLGVIPVASRPQLTFLLGLDTLERVLAPRYYGSSPTDPDAKTKMFASLRKFFSAEHDNARIVCARRAATSEAEGETLKMAEGFLADQRITLIDIGETEQTFSSTAVRDAVGRKDDDAWKNLVSPRVREYILKERLFAVD
ncbi:hypothetical protein C8R46DRAFT_897618 [Mycena filopes]|nr:hypothetical protein C8R46DRAFT_897618 [Mycena filopes]